MRSTRRPAQELRAAIDSLPLEVRQAVLAGIKHRRIIAGAHVDGSGGVCPMVAADVRWRSVDGTSVALAQEAARAWDRYTDATSRWHPATRRQVVALTAMLEASILEEDSASASASADGGPLGEVIAAHRRAVSRRAAATPQPLRQSRSGPRPDTGERDRTSELRDRPGWSWLPAFRNYDDYTAALQALSELDTRETAGQPVA